MRKNVFISDNVGENNAGQVDDLFCGLAWERGAGKKVTNDSYLDDGTGGSLLALNISCCFFMQPLWGKKYVLSSGT